MKNFDFIYPPDKEKAQKHRLASRIFKGNVQASNQLCECCDRIIGEKQVETPCNIQPMQLSFLGPGAPLFFLFVRYIIGLLFIMVITFVGFSMFSNITSTDCQSTNACITDAFTLLSIINKQSNTTYLSIQSYISLGFVVVTILFFHFFRYKSRQLQEQCDEIINSPSDYAIILRKLPPSITENDVIEAVQNFKKKLVEDGTAQAQKIKVIKVILSYNLRQFNNTKDQNIKQFNQAVKEDRQSSFVPRQLPKPSETSKIAIVVFELQDTKKLFIYKPNLGQSILKFFCSSCTPLSHLVVKGERVGVDRAPEPDQISWENSGLSTGGSICRKIVFGVVSIAILLIGGGTQYALQLWSVKTTDETIKSIIGILSSLLVTVFNAVILITLQVTTKYERAQTLTEFQTSLMVKITMAQFFNAGVFVIITQIAATYQTFSLQSSNIVSQISMIMILDAFIPNVTLFFLNYFQIIQRVKRYLIEKNYIIASQKQLNNLYTSPVIDLPSKYAYVLKTLWLTGLYSPMIPIVVIIAFVGLCINYFLQKLLFTKCYCMPSTISNMAFQTAVELLEYFLITFSIGQFIIYAYFFNYKVDKIPLQWTITIFITVGLALLNSALPMEAINERLFPLQDNQKTELKYAEVDQTFDVTYEMSNPAYVTTRKRKNKANIHGFSSLKNKPKVQELELTNLMMNQGLDRNGTTLPLLTHQPTKKNTQKEDKRTVKDDDTEKEESQYQDSYSLSDKSITVVEQSQEKAVKKEQYQQIDLSKRKKRSDQSQVKRVMKTDFYLQKLIPLQDNEIQSLKFYLKSSNKNRFKSSYKPSEEQKKQKKEEAKKLKKQKDSFYIEKALINYNFIDIKNVKGQRKWNYEVPKSDLEKKQKELKEKEKETARQYALAFDYKNGGKKQQHKKINEDYKKVVDRPNSKSSIMFEDLHLKKNEIFNDPIKEKKSTYDPLKLSKSYKQFFSDIQAMKEQKDHYLDSRFVMNFVGTPFTNLVNGKKKAGKRNKSERKD